MAHPVFIGIDTGGTFTDAVRWEGSRRTAFKVPSTPEDPARAVLQALEAAGGLPPGGRLRHGSTVGTNAVLTRAGARVVLLVTAGFEDVLHIARGTRDDLHALDPRRTEPLVPRARCLPVAERMGADRRPVMALDASAIDDVVRRTRDLEPESVAVCLLHATRAPAHERRLARALAKALRPQGVAVHASAEISADGREAERAATAVLDAFVGPKVVGYVARIARQVGSSALTIMRSDGGRMSPAEVRRAPVRTLLSGPAAGVAAAHERVRALGLERALTFDVGGTSTDVAWLEGDHLVVEDGLQVGPHRASVPSLAVETVGAGGGSLVTLDAGGALRVGPASAGADPGPACYGRGGPFTLTDAWLLLGRVPDALLAGSFALDRDAATAAAGPVAREAGMSLRALAAGAVRVAAATTARALRRASVARGHDPRGAALVAFGGAGPLLAANTAERLDLRLVVVPPDPGAFAAAGTLVAPLRADVSRAVTDVRRATLDREVRVLSRDVRVRLEKQGARRVVLTSEVDARYAGQAFEVTVPYGAAWRRAFDALHQQRYGFSDPAREVEIARLRVRGEGRERPPVRRKPHAEPRVRRRKLTGACARADLAPGTLASGPLRIEELTGTTWVPAGWQVRVGPAGDLLLERVS